MVIEQAIIFIVSSHTPEVFLWQVGSTHLERFQEDLVQSMLSSPILHPASISSFSSLFSSSTRPSPSYVLVSYMCHCSPSVPPSIPAPRALPPHTASPLPRSLSN
ncbi:unnamed protein product [Pleuronectes platessa]|uniref:Uncharacterized protein n=1 Tax=Pleuronectes platessa TaxID=8262 RepID=A0A9N7UAV4_PLEPL|nr:unnamed protein product [Pleuronectes platessa]